MLFQPFLKDMCQAKYFVGAAIAGAFEGPAGQVK
jgi:hypothetical protein